MSRVCRALLGREKPEIRWALNEWLLLIEAKRVRSDQILLEIACRVN